MRLICNCITIRSSLVKLTPHSSQTFSGLHLLNPDDQEYAPRFRFKCKRVYVTIGQKTRKRMVENERTKFLRLESFTRRLQLKLFAFTLNRIEIVVSSYSIM